MDTARDLINRLIAFQERRMMKYHHVRIGDGCDCQFTRFTEPARRAAQVKSAEAGVEFDSFGASSLHEQITRESIELVWVVLKSDFVITWEN